MWLNFKAPRDCSIFAGNIYRRSLTIEGVSTQLGERHQLGQCPFYHIIWACRDPSIRGNGAYRSRLVASLNLGCCRPMDDTGQQSIAPGEVFSSRLEKICIIGLKQTTLFLEMGNDSLKFMKGGTFPHSALPWREGALGACAKPKPGA